MIRYTKIVEIRDGNLGPGYQYFIDNDHPLANRDGAVYYHRHVASLKIGRWLTPNECAHHIDGDIKNNAPDNFEVVNRSEHSKLHRPEVVEKCCVYCGVTFTPQRNCKEFCSDNCGFASRRKFDPTVDELTKLVWEMPTISVAKMFGVSDVAVGKRCKKLRIQKPGRGYWTKRNASMSVIGNVLDF